MTTLLQGCPRCAGALFGGSCLQCGYAGPVLVAPRRQRPVTEASYSALDDGCEYAISCLGCPLPFCKHDDPIGARWEAMKLGLRTTFREKDAA